MSYNVRVRGAASFKSYDLECPECHYAEERAIDVRGLSEAQRTAAMQIMCPNCEAIMERVWRKAPGIQIGAEGSDASIERMKKSFKERFHKKEEVDVRHKFGRLYDDAKVSSAAQKIKKSLK